MIALNQIKANLKKKRQVLIDKDNPLLYPLIEQLSSCNRATIALWGLYYVDIVINDLKLIDDIHYQEIKYLIDQTENWFYGYIKMSEAKKYILSIHGFAKKSNDAIAIAYYHAIGQALACIHTPKHALGIPLYDLTAQIRAHNDVNIPMLNLSVMSYLDLLDKAKSDIHQLRYSSFLNNN